MNIGLTLRGLPVFRRFSAANDAAILAVGVAAGQAVVLALSPFLTRLFAPSEIGTLGVFSAIVAVLSVVVPLGYDQAIIGSRRRGEAMRYLAAAIIAGCALSFLLPTLGYLMLLLAGRDPGSWLVVPLIALGTVPAIATTAVQAWYVRARATTTVGVGSFVNMSARSLIQVMAGIMHAGLAGLVGGEIAGRFLGLGILDRSFVIRRAVRGAARRPHAVLHQMWLGRAFPLYQMSSSVFDIVLVWLPLPLVAFTYGAEWAGIVTLVQRIGTAPASLIGQSLVQIFHQRAGRFVDTDRPVLLRLTLRLICGITLGFIPVWLLLIVFAPPVFGVVFGENWSRAGTVAAIWAPLVLLQIFAQLASRLLILVNRQVVRLVTNVIQIVTLVGVMLIAARLGCDLPTALALSIAVSAVIYVVFIATALFQYRR